MAFEIPNQAATLRIELEPNAKDIAQIRHNLREFNRPYLESERHQPLAIFIDDTHRSEDKIAGITGVIRGNWLLIEFLWVKPELTKQGIGGQLLSTLEEQACSLSCHSALVDTFEFQAPEFYEKHGYSKVLTLEDFTASGTKYYMTKSLNIGK